MLQRAIIHVDMDAFYASVECLDDPELEGRPVIVGGLGPRGVVSTANYPARRYGVHSAMPMAQARRLCPQAAFIQPRGWRYQQISKEIFSIFSDFTPLVEGLSLDEAFLDVSASLKLFGSARDIAERIKQRVREETGLTASVGVAPNKFLAKLASDADKPDGLVVVSAGEESAFLDPMPVGRLWGIGKRTTPRLQALGILTIGQLRRAEPSVLQPVLGNRVLHYQALARGEDEREVTVGSPDKSISREITFDQDVLDTRRLHAQLQRQAEDVGRRLRARGLRARTVVVKIRDPSFRTITRSRTLRAPSNSTQTLYRMARALLGNWQRENASTPVRLIGLGTSNFEEDVNEARQAGEGIDRVFDRIQQRFGDAGIAHALGMKRRRGD